MKIETEQIVNGAKFFLKATDPEGFEDLENDVSNLKEDWGSLEPSEKFGVVMDALSDLPELFEQLSVHTNSFLLDLEILSFDFRLAMDDLFNAKN